LACDQIGPCSVPLSSKLTKQCTDANVYRLKNCKVKSFPSLVAPLGHRWSPFLVT